MPAVSRQDVVWTVRWGENEYVFVDGKSGEIADIVWQSNLHDLRTTAPSGQRFDKARSIAESFGMPKDATGGLKPSGVIHFEWTPKGHRYASPLYGDYQIDLDGRVLAVHQHWKYVIDPQRRTMQLAEALTHASDIYKRLEREVDEPPEPLDRGQCGLGYVDAEFNGHLRVAWKIRYGSRWVWVDAETGAFCGGFFNEL